MREAQQLLTYFHIHCGSDSGIVDYWCGYSDFHVCHFVFCVLILFFLIFHEMNCVLNDLHEPDGLWHVLRKPFTGRRVACAFYGAGIMAIGVLGFPTGQAVVVVSILWAQQHPMAGCEV